MIDYPAHIPAIERAGKRIRHFGHWLVLCIRHRGLPPAVVVFPDAPSRRSALYKMCRALGWELTNRPRRKAVLHLWFEDATEKRAEPPAWWPSGAWNDACRDIRKSTLDSAHERIFGYGVSVDPLTFAGRMLEKGEGNALHDGREVDGPLGAANPEKVYQRIVHNRAEDGRIVDLRLVYIKGRFPALYLKYKNPTTRYTNETTAASSAPVSGHFSDEELALVEGLMQSLSVDYAELDVLRDAGSGQLFVVDVNPTPWGPPAGLDKASGEAAISRAATVLQSALDANK